MICFLFAKDKTSRAVLNALEFGQVLDDGEPSEAFPVTNGVKQGCVLVPTLFSIMFLAMLSDAFSDYKPGINIKYRSDGKLFNPWSDRLSRR
ncbi:hypothetical protein ACOMHN_051506 [Nucella lapillus]